ncbi:MAG: GNAT family N-acetyltransferase [Alphaproteobacteria bacterium]|nr:GNAT family N-acetyltransferase [Alphaproteobacteria bacterium]
MADRQPVCGRRGNRRVDAVGTFVRRRHECDSGHGFRPASPPPSPAVVAANRARRIRRTAGGSVSIRAYQPARDHAAIRRCVGALQDFERRLEASLPDGGSIAERYADFIIDRWAASRGQIFVAATGAKIVGFVCVLNGVQPDEPDEDPREYAYVTDLFVLPGLRRQGLARRLMERAMICARDEGMAIVRVGVLAKNRVGRGLYRRLGFAEYQVQLVKRL